MPQHVTIRSRWSEFLDSYKKGDILVNLGNNVYRTPQRMTDWRKDLLDGFLEIGKNEKTDIPRYVFAPDTLPLIQSVQTIETIEILKQFGKYRLPHSICCAEFEFQPGARTFVYCYEKQADIPHLSHLNASNPFIVFVFELHDYSHPAMACRVMRKSDSVRLKADKYAVIYPLMADMQNISNATMKTINPDQCDPAGGVQFSAGPVSWIRLHKSENTVDAPIDKDKMTHEFILAGGFAIRALTSMLRVKGIARETVTQDALRKLNKKRAEKRTTAIPEHTYISLGHYYKRDGVRVAVTSTGKKQRFHLRSAHAKMQRCGPGGQDRKPIFVEAYLVNENHDEPLAIPTKVVRA